MYPNCDVDEAINTILMKYEAEPSIHIKSNNVVGEGLRMCQDMNAVAFNEKFYLPSRGITMGPAHGCDLTDIWIGDIMQKHINTCPVNLLDS